MSAKTGSNRTKTVRETTVFPRVRRKKRKQTRVKCAVKETGYKARVHHDSQAGTSKAITQGKGKKMTKRCEEDSDSNDTNSKCSEEQHKGDGKYVQQDSEMESIQGTEEKGKTGEQVS